MKNSNATVRSSQMSPISNAWRPDAGGRMGMPNQMNSPMSTEPISVES